MNLFQAAAAVAGQLIARGKSQGAIGRRSLRWYAAIGKVLGLVSSFMLFGAAQSQATVYIVNVQIGTGQLTGTIQTDGTTGNLVPANITNLDLTETNGSNYFELKGSGTSNAVIVGNSFTATATALFFNFGSSADYTMFTDNILHFICLNGTTGACDFNPSGFDFDVGNQRITQSGSVQIAAANLVATTTALTSSQNPSTLGQSVTFTATVSSTASGTPSGTVTFKDGATALGTGTLSGGTATYSTSSLAKGAHTITAVYGGDTNFTGSTSSGLTQTVNQGATTTAVAAAPNPSTLGQSVTFTATVSSTASGTPSGTVTFKDGATALGTGTLSGGTATYSTSSLAKGAHTITAVYGGDTNFTGSTSSGLTQTVNQGATTTAVAAAPNPSTLGQSVTFTATVSSTASGTPSGTVTFKDGATALGTGTLSGGTATYSTSSLAKGAHTITAVYGGDTNFTGSTSSGLTQTVNQGATTTAVAAAPNPSTLGQSVTFTATVSSTASGTPSGTVTFKDGATALGTGTLSGGTATYSTSSLAKGAHTITAVYGGDTNFTGSTSSGLTQTVNQGATTTAVAAAPNPSTLGQSVTFTATVSSTASGTPSGTVTFKDGATALGTGTLSGGTATYSTSSLAKGAHTITAVYGGDTNFTGSTSSGLTQTVNQGATTTAVAAAPNPSTLGQSVTFTATVSSTASGTPSGTVTFKDGATALGTGTLSGGTATYSTSSLAKGAHTITAVYGGDTNFTGSTSSGLTQTVNQGATTTAVAAAPNPSTLGQSVTFTATVSSTASGTPSGTVTFKDGATALGTGTLSGGTATYSTSSLAKGAHTITAVYGGDTNFTGSTSSGLTQTVNQGATTTAVAAAPNPSTLGQSVTFTATVSSTASGTPSGTVTFKDGATALGTGTLSGGTATYSTSSLAKGAHTITAVYGGDTNFTGSTSSGLTQTVNQGATTTAVAAAPNPSTLGQSVTFTATVSSTASGTPSGTVTFKDGATALGTGTLSGGTATYSTSSLAKGAHTITAVYGGDTNFTGSTSSGLTQTVNQGATTTAVAAAPNPSTLGQSVTFTATVSSTASGTPSGTVTFKDGATALGTGTLSGGTATYSTSSLAKGAHTITAVYGGDTNFTGSTSSGLTQTVNADAPTFYVSGTTGTDTGLCPVTAPCATLNYALSVADVGATITILDGGVFGPVVLTGAINISGTDPNMKSQIAADPTAQVGCIGALPPECNLANNGYGLEIAAGTNDNVKIDNLLLSAGSNGIGALKFTSGGQLQLSHDAFLGNSSATGAIVELAPNNAGTTQAQVNFSNSDVGFNNGGAIEVKPSGNTSLMLQMHHVDVHNAQYGLSADATLLSGKSVTITTLVSNSQFDSFTSNASTAYSISGAGRINSTYDGVTMNNSGSSAIMSNGPQSVVFLTNSTVSGNAVGITVSGGTVFSSVNNTIFGNGTDVSGTWTAQQLQ